MHSADIVVPSKNISLDIDNTNFLYDQQEQEAAELLSNDLNIMNLTTATFKDLKVSNNQDVDDMIDHYGSFLSQQEQSEMEENGENETEDTQLPSATADAMETYVNITENIYCGSATGKSIAEESMPCECKYRPDIDDPDAACGNDNYCINRMMFMECMVDDCPCDRYCRNRRFQLRQYARVDVIRTEKKGFGLRALTDLPANAFIMEYIGEVITNNEFIRRTKEYESAGLKHYYFMTLKTDEIIDATKKGCLARFINHSCNPNSVTQKWVVGKNMRIGIFTRRPIKAGTELTFDYKFERFGAVAQKCYCGEPSCKGYIGGSLKSDNQKTSNDPNANDIEINSDDQDEDDSDDSDDDESDQDDQVDNDNDEQKEESDMAEAVTLTQKKMLRRMHRRRASEPLQDPREVQSFVKRMLDSVGKSHLVLKLLHRLELTDADTPQGKDILKKFVRLHGLKMLKFWLGEWKNDAEILTKVLQVLGKLPLANKNGLEDSKMFDVVGKLMTNSDETIQTLSKQLIEDWNQLKSVYRIPKRNPVEREIVKEGDDADNSVTEDNAQPPYDTSREFFDPDDDYFEYLSLDADASEISWKIEYPPRSVIPTAPRAMIDACIKNGFYGFGRPSRAMQYSSYTNNDSTEEQQPHHYPFKNKNEFNHYDSPGNSSPAVSTTTSITAPVKPTVAPPKLPTNWRSAYAEDGTIYYYHRISGKTQWEFPEDRGSSIEGVNQADLEGLVEKTIQENKKKVEEARNSASPAVSVTSRTTFSNRPSPHRQEGDSLDENELKKEVGKVVTKYLSAKQKSLWNGDKFLFKELARKITHHIVDRETKSSRKIAAVNSNIRTKIEKFIDSHGADLVLKVQKKRKHQSISKSTPMESPSSVVSEEPASKKPAKLASSTPAWETEIPPSPILQNGTVVDEPDTKTTWERNPSFMSVDSFKENTKEYPPRRHNSPYRYEYVRPGYARYNNTSGNSYYRYRSPSPYYRNRYYSRKSSPYYHRNSSRRGSLSDEEMDNRRRWD